MTELILGCFIAAVFEMGNKFDSLLSRVNRYPNQLLDIEAPFRPPILGETRLKAPRIGGLGANSKPFNSLFVSYTKIEFTYLFTSR